MAINLATKYSSVIDERFKLKALTAPAVNQDYDFVGAQSVKIFSVDTAPMNDYGATGLARYGTPTELGNALQEITMSQKRSFTFIIDKTNAVDSPAGILDAAKSLSRQLDEVVIPEIDIYRLGKIASGSASRGFTVVTTSNAYEMFLAAMAAQSELKVPIAGRIAFITPTFYKLIKLDATFIKASDLGQKVLLTGQLGEVDGVPLIMAPASYMYVGLSLIITNPSATTAPQKLAEYNIHENPPGIAGNLVEGLTYYDAFVLNNKKASISVHFGVLGALTIAMVAGVAGHGTVTPTGRTSGGTLVYKTAASVTAPALGDDLSSWTAFPAGGDITATATHKIVVALKGLDDKCTATSASTTVTVG